MLDRLDASSIAVDGLSVRTPDLDDVFLSLTERPIAAGEVETDTAHAQANEPTGAAR